uniref:Matrix metalloproteinase inhibitor 1 n=1 Tax=Stichopus japonicus TaxID=307972 RepID=A0A2R3WIH0_STIJA|nr:matrix metalloproteinase inhibitor 1 [Apostichopus japonicus]
MAHTLFLTILLFFVGTTVSGQRCNCNYISHPQTRFCQAHFAFRGSILNAEKAALPGDRDRGYLYNQNLRYNVSVDEIFKGEMTYMTEHVVSLFTPTGGICGKPGLLQSQKEDNSENDFLFTGDIAVTSQGYKYLVITNCNWVARWEDLTKEQQEGLNGFYSDCGCEIYPRSEALDLGDTDADNFQVEDCGFNPISASILKVTDCETNFGHCMEDEDQVCSWVSSPTFAECFASRKSRLLLGAAAVTTRKGCNIYTGKQRKKCLLKVMKANRL